MEKSFDCKVNELKLKKLKSSFQIWTCMIGNGEVTSTEFTNILGDYRHRVNPLKEIVKSAFGFQDKHTLLALGLASIP